MESDDDVLDFRIPREKRTPSMAGDIYSLFRCLYLIDNVLRVIKAWTLRQYWIFRRGIEAR